MDALEWYGFPHQEEALRAIASQRVFITGFSGKKGSGKDTFGDAFMRRVSDVHDAPVKTMAFADALKQEVTEIAEIAYRINNSRSHQERLSELERLMLNYHIPPNQASCLVKRLDGEEAGVTGWSRTSGILSALQYLGTEIRQQQEREYWVRKTIPAILENINNDVSMVFTDVRFVHEAEFLRRLGGYLIRIDVTPETQAQRLSSRDNATFTPQQLNHTSETELDDYEFFHQRIDNNLNGKIEVALEMSSLEWERWLEQRQGVQTF